MVQHTKSCAYYVLAYFKYHVKITAYVTTAYYAIQQNVEVEEIYLLVRPDQTEAFPEKIQNSKLVFLANTDKGETENIVVSGAGTLVTDPVEQREQLQSYVQAISDETVQQLSAERDLPNDAYIVRLAPSLLKFRKDISNQPELIGALQAMA